MSFVSFEKNTVHYLFQYTADLTPLSSPLQTLVVYVLNTLLCPDDFLAIFYLLVFIHLWLLLLTFLPVSPIFSSTVSLLLNSFIELTSIILVGFSLLLEFPLCYFSYN